MPEGAAGGLDLGRQSVAADETAVTLFQSLMTLSMVLGLLSSVSQQAHEGISETQGSALKAVRPPISKTSTNNATRAPGMRARTTASRLPCLLMRNPYQTAPRDHVERCFRAIVPLESEQWASGFAAKPGETMGMPMAPPRKRLDLADARRTDQLLGRS